MEHIKLLNAEQVKSVHQYKYTKEVINSMRQNIFYTCAFDWFHYISLSIPVLHEYETHKIVTIYMSSSLTSYFFDIHFL
jgi:hypothetical protein